MSDVESIMMLSNISKMYSAKIVSTLMLKNETTHYRTKKEKVR